MTAQVIQLGSQVRDVVTGWEGIATSRLTCLDGPALITITPAVDNTGRLRKPRMFPETQCQVIGQGVNLQERTGFVHKGQHYEQPTTQQ